MRNYQWIVITAQIILRILAYSEYWGPTTKHLRVYELKRRQRTSSTLDLILIDAAVPSLKPWIQCQLQRLEKRLTTTHTEAESKTQLPLCDLLQDKPVMDNEENYPPSLVWN